MKDFKQQKIAVIGAGALGGYYGALLARAEYDVHFLFRTDYEPVLINGLKIDSIDGSFEIYPQLYDNVQAIGPSDLVIIGLKTTSNDLFEDLLTPVVSPGTVLLTLQNGLGNEELLDQIFPENGIIGGTAFLCANRVEPGHVSHTRYGSIKIGSFERVQKAYLAGAKEMFERSGVSCEVVEDIDRMKWEKLVWNCAFNVLSVVSGGRGVREILKDTDLRGTCREIMDEIIGGAHALGVEIPRSFTDKMIKASETMGDYQTSMTLDYKKGQPMELVAMVGIPLQRIYRAGGKAPVLKKMFEKIRKIKPAVRT
jgi:2-dehydropantoate 2-reductase